MQKNLAQVDIGPTATIAAAAGDDFYWRCELEGEWYVRRASVLPGIDVTANGTNHCTYTLTNVTLGVELSTTCTIAARSYIATNSVAGTPEAVTTPTGNNARVRKGDVLKLAIAKVGTGVNSRSRFHLGLEQSPVV